MVLLYVLLARISFGFTTILDTVTILWLPGGVSLAVLLLYGKKFWPAIVVGEYISNLLSGQTLLTSGLITPGASLEPLLGAWLLTRHGRFDSSMHSDWRISSACFYWQVASARSSAPSTAPARYSRQAY